jgi:hypothetical protein
MLENGSPTVLPTTVGSLTRGPRLCSGPHVSDPTAVDSGSQLSGGGCNATMEEKPSQGKTNFLHRAPTAVARPSLSPAAPIALFSGTGYGKDVSSRP